METFKNLREGCLSSILVLQILEAQTAWDVDLASKYARLKSEH